MTLPKLPRFAVICGYQDCKRPIAFHTRRWRIRLPCSDSNLLLAVIGLVWLPVRAALKIQPSE